MKTKYTLYRCKNGWLLQDGCSVFVEPENLRVFESAASLAKQLPSIIDPEEARKIIAQLPPREQGRFTKKRDTPKVA